MRIPYTLCSILAVLLLFGCEPGSRGPEMKKEHSRTGVPITVTVYEHDSYTDVTQALTQFQRERGQPRSADPSLGWAAWDHQPPYECDIHVKPPKYLNDDDMLTLGHEMAHCLYGSYHE